MSYDLTITHLPISDYSSVWQAMQQYTQQRDENSADQLWLLQHHPVFTQGVAGKPEHLLHAQEIPVIQSDRGGQITYHGPGQLMLYTLIDLRRQSLGARSLVRKLEQVIIEYLTQHHIKADFRTDAPGVYVDQAKIASIGLRVRRGCSYHGIAFNIDMDLSPFQQINPCGFKNLAITDLKQHNASASLDQVSTEIIPTFCQVFGYTNVTHSQKELCYGTV